MEHATTTGLPLLERVSSAGAAIVPLAEVWAAAPEQLRDSAAASPFAFVARLLGVEPLLVERQPIRPVPEGRSFASTRRDTPLHTDSQLFLDVPAAVQVLVCVKAAPRGGESVLVDGTRLLARLEREDPSLATALFETERLQRFYFGDVRGPTVALRGGHLAWTYAPHVDDPVGAALAQAVTREPPLLHTLAAGEALVASNHRMLHGRGPFEGERELVRLLVWLARPLAADPAQLARARVVTPAPEPERLSRMRAVLAILRGVPPAKVASDARVPEATLYGWRDAFMRGGWASL
ncbi:MAG TPA: TauD/TfdA family dioxygenase [Labilithrix sp.]|nr:TauD/TfdA family dioxygenase [Labilithrix sp.]